MDDRSLVELTMKQFLFLLFLLIGASGVTQTLTVKDYQTNYPISHVSLEVNGKQLSETNWDGRADISNLREEKSIDIKGFGYKVEVKSFEELKANSFIIFLRPTNLNLDEVVISATKSTQGSKNVPSRIVSISPHQVALQNPQTAADLLGASGEVYIQKSQQGGGSPIIRGFSTNRLLYSVDGVRMNTAIFRSGNIQNVINLDPFAIERSEVLFGPGSVIYGSDAIGGVMSFQTLTPKLSLTNDMYLSGKANLRYSSANKEKTGHFDVNVGFDKWSFVSSISSWDFSNLRQGRHGPEDYIKNYYVSHQGGKDIVVAQDDNLSQVPSAYSQVNMMQKIRFKPNEKWDFQYGFHYSETSPNGRYDRHQRVKNGAPRYAEWSYGPQIWMMNNLNIEYKANNSLFDQGNLRLAHQWFEESRIDRAFNKPERSTKEENVGAYSVNADFIKLVGDRNTLFYGFEYVLNNVNSFGKLTDITTGISEEGQSRYPNSKWQSIAAYVTDEFKMNDKFTLSGGVRYNFISLDAEFDTAFYPLPFEDAKLNNGALTGSVGGVYRPSEKWTFRANLGTAFRAPNVDDAGKVFDSEPGRVVVPNLDLKPEYAYNADLGAATIVGESVKLDATAYYTLLKNSLVRRDFKLNGQDSIMYAGELSQVQAIQNASSAYVYGVQFGVSVELTESLKASSNVNFQKGKEELDNGEKSAMRHVTPVFGVSRLNYKADRLTMELNFIFNGKMDFDKMPEGEKSKTEIYALDENGNPYSPSWYTLNFKSLYSLNHIFDISGGIENLTDQRYRPYSSGISGAGRNFILGLTAYF